MHRERTSHRHQPPRNPTATRWEIVECDDCGHDWVRPAAQRQHQLPCGKCSNRRLTVRPLLAGIGSERMAVA